MRPEIVSLLQIQQRDTRLQELRQQLQRIPREQDLARDRLAHDQQAVETAKTAVQNNEIAIKNLEIEIGTRKETLQRLKQQQFETRKNEEYRALGHEAERYEKEVDTFETRELELMEESDRLRNELEAARSALDTIRNAVEAEIATHSERAAAFSGEISRLEHERAELARPVDPDLFSLYERLLKLRGAPVVVTLSESRQCGGCHVRVTPATMVRVQNARELVQCENCGRILYPE